MTSGRADELLLLGTIGLGEMYFLLKFVRTPHRSNSHQLDLLKARFHSNDPWSLDISKKIISPLDNSLNLPFVRRNSLESVQRSKLPYSNLHPEHQFDQAVILTGDVNTLYSSITIEECIDLVWGERRAATNPLANKRAFIELVQI